MKKLIDGIENLTEKLPCPVVAIGNFDGVHLGHQAIFRKLVERAEKRNGTSVVFTFEPHPLRIIAPERAPQLLTPFKDKVNLIKKTGVDVIICANFTREFARVTAEDFVREMLHKNIGAKEVFIGSNYRFGKGRKGSPELLAKLGKKYGFRVSVMDEIELNGVVISSSRIRTLIAKGRVEEASSFLGRNYSVVGIVVEGAKRGKSLLNIPTANIAVFNDLLPKDGVYAVRVTAGKKVYGGAANIGHNPTFKDKSFSFEVHLLDFDGYLLGKNIRVSFIERIRDEIRFSSVEDLKAQLEKDINNIREILKAKT
ncbi:MAG TPA: bifunctional riboflavin kinase/FAD synthetase [Nitrospirae bacterium]|nr:bifunctional riboflavin kinase/FAD synthetase [Nitrospirota bacterium]HDK16924.1 bifunctional riboflavin kinase/FAD synthetase [Nitrospirota bacterium]HDK81464.1 bifunctional riboflavin kinase/FAD synthetase [Nitrospirota bacterium]